MMNSGIDIMLFNDIYYEDNHIRPRKSDRLCNFSYDDLMQVLHVPFVPQKRIFKEFFLSGFFPMVRSHASRSSLR